MTSRLFIRKAAQIIWEGGIIAYPTEAVFGFGCDPFNENAVIRLLNLKQRPLDKGLILIGSSLGQLEPLMGSLSKKHRDRLRASWPGPVTWLVPANPEVPYWITGDHTNLAVRVTDHPTAAALCEYADTPLVSTSANRSGQQPTKSRLATQLRFGLDVDFVVPGAVGGLTKPTEIKDLISNKVVRAG